MPIRLDHPKDVARHELPPGDPLRELLLSLPDSLDERAFDLLVPVFFRAARSRRSEI